MWYVLDKASQFVPVELSVQFREVFPLPGERQDLRFLRVIVGVAVLAEERQREKCDDNYRENFAFVRHSTILPAAVIDG